MTPLRLAVFSDRFPELSETFVTGEVEELARQGVDIALFGGPPVDPDPSWRGTVPVHPLRTPIKGRPARMLAAARVGLTRPRTAMRDVVAQRAWGQLEHVARLRHIAPLVDRLRRDGTEHIHVHFAAEAALDALRVHRLTGIPFSVTAHAYEIFLRPANLAAKLRAASFVTVPCAYNRDMLAAAGLDIRRTHVRMLGVDTRTLVRTTPYPAAGLTLAVGRLIEKKGFHVLLEAAAMQDIGPVCVIGEGPWRPRLEALIAERGLQGRVTLTGALSPPAVVSWIERASVLVVPSVIAANGDRDALPVVIWEALALEVPVIGTSVAGLPEAIRPPWGRIVAPGDAAALARAVADVRSRPLEERRAAGRAGRAWQDRYHRRELAARQLLDLVSRYRDGARRPAG